MDIYPIIHAPGDMVKLQLKIWDLEETRLPYACTVASFMCASCATYLLFFYMYLFFRELGVQLSNA